MPPARKRSHQDPEGGSKKSKAEEPEQEAPAAATPGSRQIIVLLAKANLETTKTKRNDFELLNCDDHKHIARKHGLDPAAYRPDILHQVLILRAFAPKINRFTVRWDRNSWLSSTRH